MASWPNWRQRAQPTAPRLGWFLAFGSLERLRSRQSVECRSARSNAAGVRTDSPREPCQIVELSREDCGGRRSAFDPTLARGLSYYTGAIMEINVADLAGSLGGGGRYDNLVGMFLGQERAGLRLLARPRADPGGDGRARDVPGLARDDAGRRDGRGVRRRRQRRRDALGGRRCSRGRACACSSTRRPTRSGSSSNTLTHGHSVRGHRRRRRNRSAAP